MLPRRPDKEPSGCGGMTRLLVTDAAPARLPSKETGKAADPMETIPKLSCRLHFQTSILPSRGRLTPSELFHSPEREVAYLFLYLPRPWLERDDLRKLSLPLLTLAEDPDEQPDSPLQPCSRLDNVGTQGQVGVIPSFLG